MPFNARNQSSRVLSIAAAVLVATSSRAATLYMGDGPALPDSQFQITPAVPTDQDVVRFFDPS